MSSSFYIDLPRFLLPREFDEICQLIYDAFDGRDIMPHILDEWSTRGIASDLGGGFINTAAVGGLFLARRPGGEIVGFLEADQPKALLPPKAVPPIEEEGKYVMRPPPPLPETPYRKQVRQWREEVQDPFNRRLFTSAFGNPPAPAIEVSFIGVSPNAQNMGVGKALMAEVEKLAEGFGVRVTLMTDHINFGWYQSLGYSVNATDELEVAGKRLKLWAVSKGVSTLHT